MTLEDVADALYALPPEDFTAARTAAAAADKALAPQIRALRRPTVAAWLVNRLARADAALLEQVLTLGPALADAQRTGQGDELRALGTQRRELVAAVTARAFVLAGREPAAALRAEVEATLEAALADPATADAVRSGRLTRALSYAGFGGVDLDGAVAVAPRARATARSPGRTSVKAADIAAAEARAQEAAGALDDAVRTSQRATRDGAAAEDALARAAKQIAVAEEALRAARAAREAATQQAQAARRSSEASTAGVAAAQAAAEKARTALDRLRRGSCRGEAP